MFFYSPSRNGFFHLDINPVIPDDAISITEAEHKSLLDDLSNGKEIIVNAGVITTQDKISSITWNNIRAIRNKKLGQCDYTQTIDWPGDKQAWATYRQQLRDIPQTYTNPEDVIWPIAPGT